jgi:hypothetical protein
MKYAIIFDQCTCESIEDIINDRAKLGWEVVSVSSKRVTDNYFEWTVTLRIQE